MMTMLLLNIMTYISMETEKTSMDTEKTSLVIIRGMALIRIMLKNTERQKMR